MYFFFIYFLINIFIRTEKNESLFHSRHHRVHGHGHGHRSRHHVGHSIGHGDHHIVSDYDCCD